MIFETALQQWRQHCPWREQRQVEQDLILHAMVQQIYTDPYLAERLAFRGGTCLNKIYLQQPFRYSEDLDFVQINAEQIGPIVDRLKTVLADIFTDKPSWTANQGSFKLVYVFTPEDSSYKQKVKIEINTRQHVAIKGYVKRKLLLNSSWRSGEAFVSTFTAEELLATKLRALYQRRKGRDLFDLWISQELKPDYQEVVTIFSAYMKNEGNSISQEQFVGNMILKMQMPQFTNDITPLIRPGTEYDPVKAFAFVEQNLLSKL